MSAKALEFSDRVMHLVGAMKSAAFSLLALL